MREKPCRIQNESELGGGVDHRGKQWADITHKNQSYPDHINGYRADKIEQNNVARAPRKRHSVHEPR